MSEGLPIWVIYDHPLDYPGYFVVRSQTVYDDHRIAFGAPRFAQTIEGARAYLPDGLVCLGRAPNDDPAILETWV